jgi:hypothetical protein
MPSIDLVRLRAEARDLAEGMQDPPAFQIRLRSLMESYAHRLLRRGRSMALRSALPAWEVSGILLRELDTALRPAALADPNQAALCAEAVWQSGRLEERMLAARLMGYSARNETIRQHIWRWQAETDDPVLLAELADHACRILRAGSVDLHRADLRQWIESSRMATRWFGWMALDAWLLEGADSALLTALDLLFLALPEQHTDILRTAAGALSHAGSIAPAEIQKWIMDLPAPTFQMGRSLFLEAQPLLPKTIAQDIQLRLEVSGSETM